MLRGTLKLWNIIVLWFWYLCYVCNYSLHASSHQGRVCTFLRPLKTSEALALSWMWFSKTTTLHLGSSKSGLYLLCHLIQSIEEVEFHEGLVVGLSLCQNAQSITCGCWQHPRGSQMAPPGLASTEPPSLQSQMETRGLRTYCCKAAPAPGEGCQPCVCACVQVSPMLMKSGSTSHH